MTNQGNYSEALRAFQIAYFVNLLKWHKGDVTAVANHAGVERTHLYRRFQNLGIIWREYRSCQPSS